MKTRMFSYEGRPEFPLRYDANKPEKGQKDTISALYEAWLKGGAQPLEIPK